MSQTNLPRCALLLVVSLGASLAAAGLPEITVDCGKGGDLQRALNHFDSVGFGRVRVIGTCIGTFAVRKNSSIEIVGESKETSGIEAPVGAAITAANPGHLEIHDMRLAGVIGIHAQGPRRVVFVFDSEIDAVGRGVWADAGAAVLLEQSAVSGDDTAIAAFGSEVVVEGGGLHESIYGAYLSRSALWLEGASVTGNSIGVLARDWSAVQVVGGQFAGNLYSLLIEGDSRLVSYNAPIGVQADPPGYSIAARQGGAVQIFHDDPLAEIWGTASLSDDAFGTIDGATVHGSIVLSGFSRLRLDGVVQGGSVGCDSGSDAWCGAAASSSTVGCPSAPATCSPQFGGLEESDRAPRPARAPSARERLRPRPAWSESRSR